MREVFEHPEHVSTWKAAMLGETVDWEPVFEGYVATVDWPGCTFWADFSAANPDAKVLLSHRDSAETWWRSADNTIFKAMAPNGEFGGTEWFEMATAMMERFSPNWREEASAKAAYEAHLATVRAEVPAGRLVEWQPADGWGPLCTALGVAVPDEPFPLTNTTKEWQERAAQRD
jgi:hypothetical protein